MTEIQERFEKIRDKNPNYSSYLCFAKAVIGQRLNDGAIKRSFRKLVSENDYAVEEKRETIKFLIEISHQ